VEYPYWLEQPASDAAYLYFDRYWFDIAVYADRRQLIGYGSDMLEQWGYRDIASRQVLAHSLMNTDPLTSTDKSYLMALAAPIIVVVNPRIPVAAAFDPESYVLIHEDGDTRVYRALIEPGTAH
jgi:hypothetical protein